MPLCNLLNAQIASQELITSGSAYSHRTQPPVLFSDMTVTSHVLAHDSVNLSLNGLVLKAPSGCLMHDVDFSLSIVHRSAAAPLQSDMENITAGAYAYRLLPHGEHFSSPAVLQLAYEPMSIPSGAHPEDIYTYYYDEQKQKWTQLERVKVDTIHHLIVSHTTHFTDFVNAVIHTPNMPELNAFVPTQLVDMEQPDPLIGVTLIPEPHANTHGTAEVTYPISVPMGRNGIQPNIDLVYSSANGNGLLGYGWSLPMPAITIDTRWGVPRYDTDKETEIYTLDGTQLIQQDGNPNLIQPYQSAAFLKRRNGNVTYSVRDIHNADLVVRHGNSPSNYWWTVTSRDGTVRYYGKYAADSEVNNSCVLRDNAGNIGYWALAEAVDINGNYMRYEYNIGLGNDIYLKNIYYTGRHDANNAGDVEPSYRVFFHYREREDSPSDGRLGFVRRTDSLLCYIDIANLKETPNDYNELMTNHRFIIHYHDSLPERMITKINDFPYTASYAWPTNGDCYSDINGWYYGPIVNSCVDFRYYLPSPSNMFGEEQVIHLPDNSGKDLSCSFSNNWNVGGTATVGIGFNYATTSLSAGGNYNYAYSSARTDYMLIDINGDGLTDRTFIRNDTIYYSLQRLTGDSAWFDIAHSTNIPAKGLSSETSSTHTWGLQANAGFGDVADAHVSGGMAYTNSYVDYYFTDINGDGLPDYVANGIVYFNRINSYGNFIRHGGESNVIIDSTQCATNFTYNGTISLGADCHKKYILLDSIAFTLEDLYIPPFGAYCEDCEFYCREYLYGDGDDSYAVMCQTCVQNHICDMNLACTEQQWYTAGDSVFRLCEQYQDICPRCMGVLFTYGEESEQYQSCKDFWCLFRGQRMKDCEECRERCMVDSVDCEACIEENCAYVWDDDNQYGTSLFAYGNRICDDCIPYCEYNFDSDECTNCRIEHCNLNAENAMRYYPDGVCAFCPECYDICRDGTREDYYQCTREARCRGYVPADLMDLYWDYLERVQENTYIDYQGLIELIDSLRSRRILCDYCDEICRNDPAQCIPCFANYCHYVEPEDLLDDYIEEQYLDLKYRYPDAYIMRENNTLYIYDTITVCPPLERINPTIDAVRVWVAPRTGVINLSCSYQLNNDANSNRKQSRSVDGVRCVIQHNRHVTPDTATMALHAQDSVIIERLDIGPRDYAVKQKQYRSIAVEKGDVFFFHLKSGETNVFDKVDWKQTIVYTDGTCYSSKNDFTCSSEDVFQNDHSGSLLLQIHVSCAHDNSARLEIHNANQVETIAITPYTSSLLRNLVYSADSAMYLSLSPTTGNLGSVEVRAKLHFIPSDTDALHQPYTTWMVPRIQFSRQDSLSSEYFDLFGPLYHGWGQFAYNNTDATDHVPLGTLRNNAKLCAKRMLNSGNQIPDSTAYIQALSDIVNDTTYLSSPENLVTSFSQAGIYSPTDGDWVQMKADASAYQWEAYGYSARNGRNILANTYEYAEMISSLGESSSLGSVQFHPEVTTYDSDVPVVQGQPVKTVRKTTRTTQWNVNAGISIGEGNLSAGMGYSFSNSDYVVTTDFMDMNGDRYPDVVRPNEIQYTQSWGGLGKSITMDIETYTNHSETEGQSVSGGYAFSKKIPDGNIKHGLFATHATGGLSGSTTTTRSSTRISYMDINADGLPDLLMTNDNGVTAALNIGYGFASPDTIVGHQAIDRSFSYCTEGGISGGLNSFFEALHDLGISNPNSLLKPFSSICQLSITAGVDASGSNSDVEYRLMDMDGDGLPDIIYRTGTGALFVGFVKPQGVINSVTINGTPYLQHTTTESWALNAGLTVGFPLFWFLKMNIGVNGSPFGQSVSHSSHDIVDMNGDGLPDLVWAADDGIHVRYNQMGRYRLLKQVSNSTGQKYQLDYELSAPSVEQRGRKWQLSELRNIIPQNGITSCDTMAYRFVYSDPHYDHAERTPMGYGSVETHDLRTDTLSRPVYRKHKRHYNNTDYINRGQLTYEALTDSADHRYTEYRLDSLSFVDGNGEETDDLCNKDVTIRVRKEAHVTTYFSENETDSIVTVKQYDYDRYHNVTGYSNQGDIAISGDDLSAMITYADATSGILKSRNLVSLPIQVEVTAAGATERLLKARYNDAGQIIASVVSSAADSAVTEYRYNDFGLLSRCIMPDNGNGERDSLSIVYDGYSHTLPWQVTDHWGRTSTTEYHHFWQRPTSVTDVTGNTLRYTYDNIGRLQTVQTWLDSTETTSYSMWGQTYTYDVPTATLSYTYIPCMQLRRENPYVYTTAIGRYEGGTLDTVYTKVEYDRRGRMIQRKTRRGNLWRVSDVTATDCFGRIVAEYRPFFATTDTTALYGNNLHLHSSAVYDVTNRLVRKHWQDGYYQTFIYSIGEDATGVERMVQSFIDEAGRVQRTYIAPQGWVTTTQTPDSATTSFSYDALGQLLSSTDPDHITTAHVYDVFGRRIQRIHPDAGVTRWTYAPAGNLIASATQQQINDNTQTVYEYDYDRLVAIRQPTHTELDVTFEYDSVGRIAKRADLTGVEQFTYDPMGNVIQSDKLIAVPSENNAYRFTTKYLYDIFGRMRRITYPDSRYINYYYERGLLHKMGYYARMPLPHHQVAPQSPRPRPLVFFTYYEISEYDAYDRPVNYQKGKFTTEDTYDVDRLWLSNKTTYSDTRTMQDIDYTYDAVGNIISIEQTADSIHGLGGPYMQEFQYDAQDRLTQTDMSSDYFDDYSDYHLTYSPSGMVGVKNCDDMLWTFWHGYCGVNNNIINHQVRSIYDMENDATTFFTWDAAGRLQDIFRPCSGDLRHHWWNETGQLTAMVDNGHCAFYGYDGSGERAYKLTGTTAVDQYNAGQETFHMYLNDAVIYVNPYFTISPRNYTRHFFNGSQRIATVISENNLSSCIDTTAIGAERLANARAYMQSLFAHDIALSPDTTSTFVDIAGIAHDELQWQCTDEDLAWSVALQCDSDILLPLLRQDSGTIDTRIYGSYYYHTDHLGSAAWVTKGNDAVQYLHYMPYGEMWCNQQSSAYNERYKFTGKERDVETGYDFFGARHYLPDGPMWLSPDPLMDKYPQISPYAYCAWNPIGNVDPDGRWSASIHAFSNRARSPYAIYKVHNRHGDVIFQTVVKCKGHRGAEFRDRRITYGDTPTGLYKQKSWKKSDDSRYGVNPFIVQDYLEGEAKGPGTSNRNGMHTHGGGDILNGNGELVGLKGTSGCIRMADEDIKEMKSITDALQNLDPQENMTTLTVSNDLEKPIDNFSQSRKEVKNCNGGFWLPEIEVKP